MALYWQGTAFYYANGVYYGWDGTVGGYQEVEPPAGLFQRVDSQQAAEADLFVFASFCIVAVGSFVMYLMAPPMLPPVQSTLWAL